jgi:hypothetical protein
MSSPILPIKGLSGPPTDMPSVADSAEEIGALVSEIAASERPRALIASRGGPPAELLDQIAAAGQVEELLRESGYRLRFLTQPQGQRTQIELCDRHGNSVRVLSTAEAFELAAGKPLE